MERWIFDSIRLGDRNRKIIDLIENHFTDLETLTTPDKQTILHAAADSCNIFVVDTIFEVYARYQANQPHKYHD